MSKTNYKLLLVDDCKTDYMLVDHYLSSQNEYDFELHWHDNYDEGLNRMTSESYDACLLDYSLGHGNGVELARNAKQRGSSSPNFLCSGIAQDQIQQLSQDEAIEGFISKSNLSSEAIITALRNILKHRDEINAAGGQDQTLQIETLSQLPYPVMAFDKRGRVLISNQALANHYALPISALSNANAQQFLKCNDIDMQRILMAQKNMIAFSPLSGAEMSKFCLRWTISPFHSNKEQDVAYIAVAVVEQKRRKKTKQKAPGLFARLKGLISDPGYIDIGGSKYHRDLFS